MSGPISPTTDLRSSVPLPFVIRAVTYAVAWLPYLALSIHSSRNFEPLFHRLRESGGLGELPTITQAIFWISRANQSLGYAPFLIGFGILLLADLGVARFVRRSQRTATLFALWFITMTAAGFLAAALVLVATLMPIHTIVAVP